MNLAELNITAQTMRSGSDNFVAVAGQTLKIETTPDGEEILCVVVPEGKQWAVCVVMQIIETDL